MEGEANGSTIAAVGGVLLKHEGPGTEDQEADAEHEYDDISSSRPKKKRRVIQESDKKYECPHTGCTKAYSRAEHLYRHQLNHTPKQIYRCDFPGCDRNFVRADLCARHKERHTAKGSHLQRKDAFLNSQKSATTAATASHTDSLSSTASAKQLGENTTHGFQTTSGSHVATPQTLRHHSSSSGDLYPASSTRLTNLTPIIASNGRYDGTQWSTHGAYDNASNFQHYQYMPHSAPADNRAFTYSNNYPPAHSQHFGTYNQQSNAQPYTTTPSLSSPHTTGPVYGLGNHAPLTPADHNFRPPHSFTSTSSIPTYNYAQYYDSFSNSTQSGSIVGPPLVSSSHQPSYMSGRDSNLLGINMFDQVPMSYTMPVFGSETPFNRSPPPTVDENFLNMLFATHESSETQDASPSGLEVKPETPESGVELPKIGADQATSNQTLPSLSSGFDINIPQSMISAGKQERLFNLVQSFGEIGDSSRRRTKASILNGSTKDPNHVMSEQVLRIHITSFWVHLHQQIPILHRPTFNADVCPDLLLLTVMCLGACCLERTHSMEMTQASAEWAFFVAYHIRWELFKDPDFKPTAKLWTFQCALLLELFEKMFSTRSLHETGHVHHGTTLTVMRRGSSLIGRSVIESPGRTQDPTRTPPGPEGSINVSGQNTTNAQWNRWITAEATRRAAYAAFIIDATHATLFGHSAIMSPHELRLPLPCDEALWSATSSAELRKVETNLAAKGCKPTSFLEGMRRTLSGQKVRTNTFGRIIIMAGLLNVSWHMNQRDLQVSSLGASSTLGSQIKWRSPLTRAFDFWRKDFDESMSKNDHSLMACQPKANDPCSLDHREVVFESRTCLHSLAHMAMHVEIIDCQVFAGSDSAVGRMVTDSDRTAVQRRMREQWAPSARARDAVFYALRFLCEVMIPEEQPPNKKSHPQSAPTLKYSPRHDYLLNRPWVLYFATLIVWSYGYALDGPIKNSDCTFKSRDSQIDDMQRFLIRMGGVASPDDLENLRDRNFCVGLLLLLREKFVEPRWELMHEAGETLGSCIKMLLQEGSTEIS